MTTLTLSAAETRLAATPYPVATTSSLAVPARTEVSEEVLLLAAELVAAGGVRNSLVLTGAEPGVSSCACAADLGRALVQLGYGKVMVIEADGAFRANDSSVRLASSAGLVDVLDGSATLLEATNDLGDGLSMMRYAAKAAAGEPDQGRLVGVPLANTLRTLQERYCFVLIAAPPLAEGATARLISMHSNAVVLLARRGTQTRSSLTRAHAQLTAARIKTLGVVLV